MKNDNRLIILIASVVLLINFYRGIPYFEFLFINSLQLRMLFKSKKEDLKIDIPKRKIITF